MQQEEIQNADTDPCILIPALFADFVSQQNQKNIMEILEYLHPESPAYGMMAKSMEALFSRYTLHVNIIASIFAGNDNTYVYYRFLQTIEKIVGPDFNNCEVDNLVVFRRNDTNWKIWNFQALSIKELDK